MNRIIFPLENRMQGRAVADLQAALVLLLDRALILGHDERARAELSAALRCEVATSHYGNTTARLVSAFQREKGVESTGTVDEPTARALNAVLEELGALSLPPPSTLRERGVEGQVRHEDGRPFQSGKVRAFQVYEGRRQPLGEAVIDAAGVYSIRYAASLGVEEFQLSVEAFDSSDQRLSESDPTRQSRPVETVNLVVRSSAPLTTNPEQHQEEAITKTVQYADLLVDSLRNAQMTVADRNPAMGILVRDLIDEAARIKSRLEEIERCFR